LGLLVAGACLKIKRISLVHAFVLALSNLLSTVDDFLDHICRKGCYRPYENKSCGSDPSGGDLGRTG